MWIKLAKANHRSILEKAYSFVIDSNADNKIALFLWKLKQLKGEIAAKAAKNNASEDFISGFVQGIGSVGLLSRTLESSD